MKNIWVVVIQSQSFLVIIKLNQCSFIYSDISNLLFKAQVAWNTALGKVGLGWATTIVDLIHTVLFN